MKKYVWIIVAIVLVLGLIGFLVVEGKKPGKFDTLAQCISDSGAKFYGAWWCQHCQAQKAMFGKSAKKLPYVECQTQGRKATEQCTEAKIEGYPTWEFSDSTRQSGKINPDALAAKTNCVFPQ